MPDSCVPLYPPGSRLVHGKHFGCAETGQVVPDLLQILRVVAASTCRLADDPRVEMIAGQAAAATDVPR